LDVLGWDASDFRHDLFDFLGTDCLAPLGFRNELLRSTRFVNHVNRFVRQFAIMDVAAGKLDRRFDRIRCEAHIVMLFKVGLESLEDFGCIIE